MARYPTLLFVAALLVLARPGEAQVRPTQTTQSVSEVARILAGRGSVLQAPADGRVKAKWGKEAPSFDLANGASTAVLLRLPEYRVPYLLRIASSRRGFGRTTEIFIPSAALLDDTFQEIAKIEEGQFAGGVESLVAELRLDEGLSAARYLFLFTRGDRVGRQVILGGQDLLDDVFSSILQKGLLRVERSLAARLQVDTKRLPGSGVVQTKAPSDIVRDLVERRAAVAVPAVGKVKHVIGKHPPTFVLSGGPTSVAALQLPEYQGPWVLKLKSLPQRSGIFVPSGILFDREFQLVDEFGEDRVSRSDVLTVELGFSDISRNSRYLLLYTRGDLVGMAVWRSRVPLLSTQRYPTNRLLSVTRSLEAKLEIEATQPNSICGER